MIAHEKPRWVNDSGVERCSARQPGKVDPKEPSNFQSEALWLLVASTYAISWPTTGTLEMRPFYVFVPGQRLTWVSAPLVSGCAIARQDIRNCYSLSCRAFSDPLARNVHAHSSFQVFHVENRKHPHSRLKRLRRWWATRRNSDADLHTAPIRLNMSFIWGAAREGTFRIAMHLNQNRWRYLRCLYTVFISEHSCVCEHH